MGKVRWQRVGRESGFASAVGDQPHVLFIYYVLQEKKDFHCTECGEKVELERHLLKNLEV